MAFGKEIKRLRENAGLTANAITKLLGIDSLVRYKAWEQYDSNPKFEDRKKIEKFFKMDLEEIIKLKKIPADLLSYKEKLIENNIVNEDTIPYKKDQPKTYLQKRFEQKNTADSIVNVPVYDIEFTAGFIEIINTGNNVVGYFNFTEFAGCDAVVRCRNNSMLGIINPNDFVGIRRITDFEDIELGAIYGIVTKNFALFKYIQKAGNNNY